MITVNDIISKFPPVKFTGVASNTVSTVVELGILNNYERALSWCNQKNISLLTTIKSGVVICPVLDDSFVKHAQVDYIETDKPRHYFLQVLKNFFAPADDDRGIASSAKISPNVKIGQNISVGQNVVIEEGTLIGDDCSIGHNTVIYRNTVIGNNVTIGANCTIGGPGFGYEKNELGEYEMLPHIGNVVIEPNVEIANNVCIDRAVLSSTIIGENVKIDNLVHVAHNVIIGKNSLLIANSMIGGSTVIGENVWVAPSASIMNKINIANNVVVGMGAVVIKPVAENTVVAGNPAQLLLKKKDGL